jgi:hypothetical protein
MKKWRDEEEKVLEKQKLSFGHVEGEVLMQYSVVILDLKRKIRM